jgi:uncharacterized surface protein with fasciclin (FAS1) repeats
MRYIFRPIAFLAAFGLAACGDGLDDRDDTVAVDERPMATEGTDDVMMDDRRTLAELFEDEPRFSTFQTALEASGLQGTFEDEGPMTVFVPSNEAFEALPAAASVDMLLEPENRALLRRILAFHIVPERLEAASLAGGSDEFETVGGDALAVTGSGSVVEVGSAPQTAVVTLSDIQAENGVVHVIDAVLLPPVE